MFHYLDLFLSRTHVILLSQRLNWRKGLANAHRAAAVNYLFTADFKHALDYFSKALKIYEEFGDRIGIAKTLGGLGLVYENFSDFSKALDYDFKSLKIFEELNDSNGISRILNNIGIIYIYTTEYSKGLKYCLKSLAITQMVGNISGTATAMGNIGLAYTYQKEYSKALEYYLKSLTIHQKLGNTNSIALMMGNIGNIYSQLGDHSMGIEYFFNAIHLYKQVNNKSGMALNLGRVGTTYLKVAKEEDRTDLNKLFSGNRILALQTAKAYLDSNIFLYHLIGDVDGPLEPYKSLSEIYQTLGDDKAALSVFKTYSALKDSVFNLENNKKLTQIAMQYDFDKKEAALKTEQEKKDLQQRNIRNSITLGFAFTLIILLVVYRQRNRISKARKRSDELLLNILPEEVAEELKASGRAEAKQFDEVTVLFTDFKDFTKLSEHMSARELVEEIHTCFMAFDNIMEKNGIEKIKTIGDSYMCAGGLPVANKTHASDVVNAGLEIKQFILNRMQERTNSGKEPFQIRIGIHTGPVVAGIVGIKKFAYDIWGDTVNTASRMESSDEVGQINISGTTYELVKDKFNCTYRGKIQAKNKGELDMYFVDGRI